MSQSKIAIITVMELLILLTLHLIAMNEYWYIRYPLFDLVTHTLGGVGIALTALYVFKNPKYIIPLSIIGGIAWELFEVYFDITGWPIHSFQYKFDTAKDLIMDTLGAVCVWLIVRKIK